jgi:hypothetical protein
MSGKKERRMRGLCLGNALALCVLLGGVADGQPWSEYVSYCSFVVLWFCVLLRSPQVHLRVRPCSYSSCSLPQAFLVYDLASP